MSAPRQIEGACATPQGWFLGRLRLEAGRIVAMEGSYAGSGTRPAGPWLVPGFVDLHVHGGDGVDVMSGASAVRQAARYHLANGTTSWCPTTVTAASDQVEAALRGIESVRREPRAGEADVLGAHLEGPFISAQKLGAQPPFAQSPDLKLAQSWLAAGLTRVATFAPELPAAEALVALWNEHGVRAQIGHTCASAEVCRHALNYGASGFTHLFNAMSGAAHREPGAAAAALAHAQWAEILCDLVHVSGTSILAAWRAIPGLYAVSDATPAAGAPDGPFFLGAQPVQKRGQLVLLNDGLTLAGSASPLSQGFANLLTLGLDPLDASQMCSTRPAAYLGLTDRGSIAIGQRADLLEVHPTGQITRVFLAGQAL